MAIFRLLGSLVSGGGDPIQGLTPILPPFNMRPIHAVLALWSLCYAHEVERPVAIIPWSQYQMRMREAKTKTSSDSSTYRQKSPWNEHKRMPGQQTNVIVRPPSGDQMPPRPKNNNQPVTPRPRSHRPVIRSQIRNRIATEPADFKRKYQSVHKNKPSNAVAKSNIIYPPAPNVMPHKQPGIRKVVATSQAMGVPRGLADIRIPNGVPLQAGTWEDGQPHYIPQRGPVQFAAGNIAGIDPSIPLEALNRAQMVSSPLNGQTPNIVNSIFSQSQAQGLPLQSLPNVQTNPSAVESFLANSGNLETISKLAKNLLNVGGPSGQQGSLLDVMANALRGSRLPLTSAAANDDMPPTVNAARAPQRSLMERLLNQAATAINTSIKEKEKVDKVENIFAKPEPEKEDSEPSGLSEERKNSLKLLAGLPKEQREILEAAIISKEIDPETLGPAIGALVKEDTKEDSKKEKESRLLEWIRANRPTKTAEVKVSADKLPYYGKYCGSFVEELNIQKKFHPSGALWAVDEKHLIVSKFFFQPGSLLSENVSFWLGPDKPTKNSMVDQFPSINGFYIHPTPIDVAVFALEELPAVPAKVRENIDASVLLNGTSPIVPVSNDVSEKEKRFKRNVVQIQRDEKPPIYVPAQKPVELLVKGGVVHVMGEGVPNTLNDTDTAWNATNSILDEMATLRMPAPTVPSIRLKQPEYDGIDYSIAQPLEWYAGFQPLLITLPAKKRMSDLKWVSLRDHKRNETIASVLIPNGPAFIVPSPVKIRPLSPNGLYNISSGQILINDMKSIEISNFTLRTGGEAVWFMMGRDILPNVGGSIIPIYDRRLGMFDCNSLRDYFGETVYLRIPGHLDMRDVFWFSVFSPTKSISFSHLYLPYDHLRLPPDLKGTPTVTCTYKP